VTATNSISIREKPKEVYGRSQGKYTGEAKGSIREKPKEARKLAEKNVKQTSETQNFARLSQFETNYHRGRFIESF